MHAMEESSQNVKVAVNVRPLVTSELLVGCTDCISVYPAEKQVQIGSHAFTFDYVYGSKGDPSSKIFDDCVVTLVEALFHGYNGTVLAYGQTGSGKTYTMGTNYNGEEHENGVLPKVMDYIFSKVEKMKESTEFLIRVSFIEIFKEEVFDLLDPKTSGLARVPIQIREKVNGEITLSGVTDAEVRTKQEMASYLLQGSLSRATGSTNMNSQSSRSHAIFTISMEQRRTSPTSGDDSFDDVLIAKLHLVDLAGSERAKRTGADGTRLQEGIHINKGLLALGNVISALGDERKRKEGGHVPYRDSKLTRILQDSLGGNSKTIMIACISPADTNAEETLNTLKYANRARNIQNKAIINHDPVAAQMQRMRSQIEQLQTELLYFRGDSCAPAEEIEILKQKISLLETSNEHMRKLAIDAQVERDQLMMKIKAAQLGKPLDEADIESNKELDVMKTHASSKLESDLLKIKNAYCMGTEASPDYYDSEDNTAHSLNSCLVESDEKKIEADDIAEVDEKELEHSSLQERMDRELKELDKRLEQKEAEMKRFMSSDTSVLKQHYEKKVQDLELEKKSLQKEIEELRNSLVNISSNSGDGAQKLKEEYLQKLNVLETQVAELKKKQDAQAQLLRQKQKSDEAAKRLQDEILRIKTHKVQLQQKIKQESEQFRLWKANREKEVLQLKKEGRRNEYEMHKLLALNQRQKQVLHRKTEEAAMATKRLKDLLESRKASRETPGSKGPGVQALVRSIEHELEVTVGVHEVRSKYERQMNERSKMAEEVARLKEEVLTAKQQNLSDFPQTMSPGARNSRIFALENMLATSSSALVSMASHLSEAEERERAFSGKGRWNQVRSMAEAKHIMDFLFNLASSTRCHLSDRECDCREKDSEIRDLKEKIVNLIRQLEQHKLELFQKEKLIKLAMESTSSNGHAYDLRFKGNRNSIVSSVGVYGSEVLEDMDTSDDDFAAHSNHSDDEDGEWEWTEEKKRREAKKMSTKMDAHRENGSCCSCSKSSSCKTSKCECRAAGYICTSSCSCEPSKCSNIDKAKPPRDVMIGQEALEVPEDLDCTESSRSVVLQGAALLTTALSEKIPNTNDGSTARKPLSDIGNNSLARSNIPKPNTRKKWRKSVIQIVPTPPVSQDQNVETPAEQPKTKPEITPDVPLKLPRAMRSTLMSKNQLKDRNDDDQTNKSVNTDTSSSTLGSSFQDGRKKEGKENLGM